VPNPPSSAESHRRRRGSIVAAGLLLAALALVVLYTSRSAFLSPLALIVVAAIGVAALLLQRRLQPQVSGEYAVRTGRSRLWLNGVGVLFAGVAVLADALHLGAMLLSAAALAAVVSFAASGLLVLRAMRKRTG
jgi:uncharacterized membrane protein